MWRTIWTCLVLLASSLFARVSLIEHSPQKIVFQVTPQNVQWETVQLGNRSFARIWYSEAFLRQEPGKALLPYTRVRLLIPPGAQVKVRSRAGSKIPLTEAPPMPALVLPEKRDAESILDILARNPVPEESPPPLVQVGQPYRFRHYQAVDVEIYPVRHEPGGQKIWLVQQVTVTLELQGGEQSGAVPRSSTSEKQLLSRLFLNYPQAVGWAFPQPKARLSREVNYDFSAGAWYKIPIQKEGVYRITGAFLRQNGIDIDQMLPETIQMFNYGGAPLSPDVNDPRPSDLNEIAIQVFDLNGNGKMDDQDYVLFYGRGVDGWTYDANKFPTWQAYHHPYDVSNYYLFTYNQQPGKRMEKVPSPDQSNVELPTKFEEHLRFEEDHNNWFASGPDWYWVKLQGLSDQARIPFTLPQNLAPGEMKLKLRFKGESESWFADPNQPRYRDTLDVFVNDVLLVNDMTIFSNNSKTQTFTFPDLTGVQPGLNEMLILHRGNLEGCRVHLDYFEFHFSRPFIAEEGQLKFNHKFSSLPAEFSVSGLGGTDNRVWDVSQFDQVREILPLQNGSQVRFQDTGVLGEVKEYLVFSPSTITDVEQILPVENSPNLRDPSRRGKLVIILPDEFYSAAERLEQLRENQQPDPIETERVRLSEIYREFSSAVQDPVAIRDFLRYAYFNWAVPPEYVLLMGDGSYDYRNIVLTNYINRVPPFEIEGPDEIDSRESDNFYVALNHSTRGFNSIVPELGIGRFPANSVSDIEAYLDKLEQYQHTYLIAPEFNGWQNVITLVADDEVAGNSTGEWFHLQSTEQLVKKIPRKFDLKKIYLHDYEKQAGGLGRIKPKATEDLLNQINRGSLIINFFGHGNPTTWAHEWVLQRSRDLPRIQNEGRLPLWLAATCNWGRFDDPNINSMAEDMVVIPERGGIGVIAASRAVYASGNEAFVLKLASNSLKNQGRSAVLGDALLASLAPGRNDQKFHLFGDPTLRLADPEHQVEILSITPDTLKALSTVTIEAVIKDSNGNLLSDFNGEALIRVFDAQDTLKGGPVRYVYQGGTIFKGIVDVKGGYLNGSFIVPRSIKYKKWPTGRISVYAWSENLRDAVGYREGILLYGSQSGLTDQEGPEILFSFEEYPDFMDGDYVPANATLLVQLFDENGINLTGEVGHRIELTIDGTIRKDVTEFFVYNKNSFQQGQLRYPLPSLQPGEHTLKIVAWDNLNNFSEQEVRFRTSAANQVLLDEVLNYPNPFAEDTYFTFQFDSPAGFARVKIRIYTIRGRLIQELEGIARPGFNKIYWDGRDRDGEIPANGVYLYKIIVDDGEHRLEKIEKLAIVR